MRTLKLTIAYDGTDFVGWQVQPNGPSIQSALEQAILSVTGCQTRVSGSGRTDSGVHALAQVASVHLETRLSNADLLRALNANLPPAIAITAIEDAPVEFDAQRSAKWKQYRYVLFDGPVRDVFLTRFAWQVPARLDEDAMQQEAQQLLGTHDFRCFETEWPNRASSIRTIRTCGVSRQRDFLHVDVEADGFLYNMVRSIVGTLVQVGRGRWPLGTVTNVLTSGDRRLAGPTAPPQGLFLVRVLY